MTIRAPAREADLDLLVAGFCMRLLMRVAMIVF